MNFFKKFDKLHLKYKDNRNKIISTAITMAGIACLIIGSSFAYLMFQSEGETQTISAGTLALEFINESESITLLNAVPQSDELGITNQSYNFTLKNTGTISSYYEIRLNNDCIVGNSYNVGGQNVIADLCIPNQYIKVAIKIGNKDYKIVEYGENGMIASGTISASGTMPVNIIIWLSSETPNDYQGIDKNVIYNGKISLFAKQLINLDNSGANAPELATGMIPVYYDAISDTWRKADSENRQSEYRWYNYTSDNNDVTKGMWANAVTYDRTKVHDESGKNQDGIITGATYTSDGMSFDGTDDIIKAVGTKEYNFGSTITVAARFKISSEDQNEIYSKIIDQLYETQGFAISYIKESSVLAFEFITTSSIYTQIFSPTLEKDTWYTAVGTYDGTTQKLYINGNLVGSKEVTGAISVATYQEISVGRQDYTGNWPFKGTISDVLVINEALDATTIANNYGTNFNYNTNLNTVFYYNMRDYTSRNNGTAIPMSMINTMFVWIPRFSAVTPSNYNGGTQTSPGAIDVTFVNTTTSALDAFWWDENNNGIKDTGEQKSGFWFGKFENSATSIPTDVDNTNHTIIIKPNVVSWGLSNISTFFNSTRIMENAGNIYGFDNTIDSRIDTHLTKNNEWAAMAYLTQSIYGRCTSNTSCTEVTMNNCSSAITGIGADTITADSSSTTCTSNGNKYNGTKGKLASTTGTIYGIYDVSGGRNDYVMGDYNSYIGSSGFTSLPESKYYNNYLDLTFIGDALNETAGWYGNGPYFQSLSKTNPWIIRGGCHADGSLAGIFCNGTYGGGSAIVTGGSRTSIIK